MGKLKLLNIHWFVFYNISIYTMITYSFMHYYVHPVTIVLFRLNVCVV